MNIDDVDDLFAIVPSDFVAARDQLAARRRAGGQPDEARAIRRIPRPTVAVWALNQLARQQPDGVAALLDAADGVRDAQEGRTARRLREASDQLQARVSELTQAAARLVVDAGVATSGRDAEVTAALRAAALGGDAAQALRSGTLRRLPEVADDTAMWATGAPTSAAERQDERSRRAEAARSTQERAAAAVAAAQDRLVKAQAHADDIQTRLDEQLDKLTALRSALVEAEAGLRAADEQLGRVDGAPGEDVQAREVGDELR